MLRLLLYILIFVAGYIIGSGKVHAEQIPEIVQLQHSANTKRFLGQCTGMPITSPQVETMAYLSCMARVRGMSDGHALTAQIFAIKRGQLYNHGVVIPDMQLQVWCITNDKKDGEVFQAVLNWIDANNDLVNQLNKRYTNPNQVGIAIIITSLRETYPCKKGTVG
ncbi:MAG: hypothetical protein E4H14_16165 [Candidatus Thorarchaeota archaeon]|nr:MAG: hypothetical protein E4H14_16165 [Candidatus Thorarchaeota archaeon]